jgi:ADP-ribose pyrophosphatase YjhB (NUDIX family)
MTISSTQEMYLITDELRAVANLGLMFPESHYDRGRSERVLAASARLVAALDRRSPDEVLHEFKNDLSHVSPHSGANSAVFRDGQILLIRREDDGLWAMPGGFADVGETLAEAAERELWEEANVRGRATRLLGVFDNRFTGGRVTAQSYVALFLVEAGRGEPRAGPETTGVGYYTEDKLPDLTPHHQTKVPLAFKLHRNEIPVPYFDPSGNRGQRNASTSLDAS